VDHYGWAFLGFLAVPISFVVAILRYRLYDIGRLARRSITYAVVVVILGFVYASVTLALGSIVAADDEFTVATAALAAAAVCNPARRRVQEWFDRRFNRTRYDLAATIDAFGRRLRQHVDLSTLAKGLCALVYRTMQPAGVSIWIRPTTPTDRRPRRRPIRRRGGA
jgi:hypothetical protein